MKISHKLILFFLIIALLPLAGVGAFAYFNTQRALNHQISIQLTNTTNRQADKLETVVDQQFSDLTLFSTRQQLRLLLADYNQHKDAASQAALNDLLSSIQQDDRSFRRIHIVDINGKVIASSDPRFIGRDYSHNEAVIRGSSTLDVSVFFHDIDGKLAQYFAAPLTIGSQKLGTAVMESQVDSVLQITQDYVDLGSTGETYLTRPAGTGKSQYVTPLRFNDKAALTTVSPGQALSRDYRSHPVLAFTKAIPRTDWTIVVKIDQAEVFAPVYQLRDLTLGVTTTAALLAIVFAFYASRAITAPIRRLTTVIERIRGGNATERAKVESHDEIGLLATSFNELTDHFQESQARLAASIAGLSQGFVMIDADSTIVMVNQAAQTIFKRPTRSNHPFTVTDIFADIKDFQITTPIKQCLKEQKPVTATNLESQGSFYDLYVSPIITNGVANGAVILINDTTEERVLQRSRDEFFSIASHELRTPLTAMRGNASMMQQYYADQLKDPGLHEMVVDIEESSTRLINIVSDFLDMSRLEQGKVKFDLAPISLEKLIETVASEIKPTLEEKTLTLNFDAKQFDHLPQVYADAGRVKQILQSLTGNATKFTEHGTITISGAAMKDQVRVSVQDTGRGIALSQQKFLFHKFQQAGDSLLTRDTSRGTGLGLYISRLLARGMGGDLQLDHSEEGKGSAFSFILPIATPEYIKHHPAVEAHATTDTTTGLTTSVPE